MNRHDQAAFIMDLLKAMRKELVDKVRDGTTPEEWDGHELRCLIADKAASNAAISSIRKYPRHARAKAYKNTILTTNLL